MSKRRPFKKRKLDIETALTVVPDDLPDGAFFAMLDELTGSEPGGACDLLADAGELPDGYEVKQLAKPTKGKKSRRKTR